MTPTARAHRSDLRLVDAHFAGRITPEGERALRAHLPTCASCRAHYERHLHLGAVDPEGTLPARQRLAHGLGLAAEPAPTATLGRRPSVRQYVAAAALALAAVVVVAKVHGPSDPQVRGGGTQPASQLLVYEVGAGGAVKQVTSEMDPDGALAFAYANIGGRRHLMVFAVDDGYRVYWYHPAWQDGRENPVAVSIAADRAIHEIPQAVRHRFEGRHVQLFSVFADQPLSVKEVEAALARAPADAQGRLLLALPGAEVARLDLRLGRPGGAR
jgi:hypothetical protein